jgi:hypothetical protein
MELKESYLEEAILVTEDAARQSKVITSNRGKGSMTNHINLILRELVRKDDHSRDRNWMIKRFWQEGYSNQELDIVLDTLSTALIVSGGSKNPIYTLKPDVVKDYDNQFSGIMRRLDG